MSKFNIYAKKVDELARRTFEEFATADATYKKAETTFKTFPQRVGGTQNADVLRARAAFVEAEERMRQVRHNMDSLNDDVSSIRKELVTALTDAFAADPSQIDTNTLTLLQSGILKSYEYAKLMNTAAAAGNCTMTRLIAHHARIAADTAAEKFGEGDHEARALRVISAQGNADPASAKLQEFDALADIFRRAMRNTAMIGSWDQLAGPIIEGF